MILIEMAESQRVEFSYSKKKKIFLYLHRTIQQTTMWLDTWSSHIFQSVIKVNYFL
jgi:hypothetical protein